MNRRLLGILPVSAASLALLGTGLAHTPLARNPNLLSPIELHSKIGCSKWMPPGSDPGFGSEATHLNYYGGKVISHVKVVYVLYGAGTYAPFISSDVAPSMKSFYTNVVNSNHIDWLSEYNTPTQKIGRGSFIKKVQITPSPNNNPGNNVITDAMIRSEISLQIAAGHLPVPDASPNNTIYMVHFPKGKSIHGAGSASCVAGGFCAYHGTGFDLSSREYYYGVIPDFSPGSGCDGGCGGSTWFNNQCSVASHELIEAITDPEVGIATTYAPPLAWYDPAHGEIGDICNANQGTFLGADGITYTVQKEWSNVENQCIARRRIVPDVTSLVLVTRGRIVHNAVTGYYQQTDTIKNISAATITGPFSLVLDNVGGTGVSALTRAHTVRAAPAGSPFYSKTATLAPGASTNIAISFSDPGAVAISYTTRVLAGIGDR